jgi:hypothetical protein
VDEQSIKSRLEILTPIAGGAAILVYVVGFLVLSIHHASFGILDSGLLRPRILSAGVIFCILTLIPAIETIRLSGPDSFEINALTDKDEIKNLFSMIPYMVFPLIGSGMIIRIWVGGEQPFLEHVGWIAGMLLGGGLVFAIPLRNKGTLVKALRSVIAMCWICFCLYKTRDHMWWLLSAWFMWCAFITFQVSGTIKNFERLKTVNVAQTVVTAFGTIAAFGLFIYPRVPALVGGGSPIPATLCFAAAAQPNRMWILDDTDAGFYLLPVKDAKKAIFIPRSGVTEIQYGDTTAQQALACISSPLPQVHDLR